MAQSSVVAGIDVAKDKVDACIRTVAERPILPSTTKGRRQLVAWVRKHKVTKVVMEASGGYEREWAKALRQAGIEVRIVDPKRVRSFALSAGCLRPFPGPDLPHTTVMYRSFIRVDAGGIAGWYACRTWWRDRRRTLQVKIEVRENGSVDPDARLREPM